MTSFTLRPVALATDMPDSNGLLVFAEEKLIAVLSRLDASFHGKAKGKWFLEIGFGNGDHHVPAPFDQLSDAVRWIADSLLADGDVSPRQLEEIDQSFGSKQQSAEWRAKYLAETLNERL